MIKIKFSKKHSKIFEELGVETVYLFGSAAQAKMGPLSDIDIGVIFTNPEKYKNNTMEPYLKLYDIFTDVLPKKYLQKRFQMKAHEFDLVFLQFAPVNLQFNAVHNSVILYEKDKEKRMNYQEDVLKRYLDFKYIYDLFHKEFLNRI